MLEEDVLVQQVVDLLLHRETPVDAVTACKVQRVYRLLLDVSQTGDAYGVDAGTLQIVEQGNAELAVVAESG